MTSIAILIPARAGSKGIPGKNLINLGNRPLIDYTLDFASKLDLPAYLSSDSETILKRADLYNINKIKRPKSLAQDNSKIYDTLIHAAGEINKKSTLAEAFLVLQPTYLVRNHKEIKEAINIFNSEKYETLVSLTKALQNPCECIKIENNSNIWSYLASSPNGLSNRQEYEDDFYFISGNFYLAKINSLIKYKTFMHKETKFFISNEKYPVDIDTFEDIEFAKSQLYRINP